MPAPSNPGARPSVWAECRTEFGRRSSICGYTNAPQQKATYSITSSARASRVGAERLGCRQIDGKIELGWLLDWNFGRFGPAQNLVDIVPSTSEKLREVCSVRYQTSPFYVLATTMHRRYPRGRRQDVDANQ